VKKMMKRLTSTFLAGMLMASTFIPLAEASNYVDPTSKSSVTQSTYNPAESTVSGNVYGVQEKKYIVKLKNADSAQTADRLLRNNNIKGKLSNKITRPAFIQVALKEAEKELLVNDQNVEYIEVDSPVSIAAVGETKKENGLLSAETTPWGLQSIGANLEEVRNHQGNTVKIAVLDTGISAHEDLVIAGGVSFVPDMQQYADDNGHGTHVAGTIAAANNMKGVVGVAPRSDIYAVKVLDNKGGGSYSQVINGIYWAIDNNMDVISMSFGGTQYSRALHEAIQEAERQGILIVAAAGNRGFGPETELYPALYPEVISVGAVTKAHKRASYSSTGSELDIVAPGTEILSTTNDGGYGILTGTSMAAPHVTGAIAVLLAKNKTWSGQQIKDLIYESATPLGSQSEYGHGLLNLAKALGVTDQPIPPLEQGPVSPEPGEPSNDFTINKKDVELLQYSQQLRNLKLKAIRANNKALAKEIDAMYYHLLSYSKSMHRLPLDIRKATEKLSKEQKIAAADYFDSQKESILKLERQYKDAISKYASALSVPFSQQSGINVLSINPVGDGQTVKKGDPATVSVTLEQEHSSIMVYVDKADLSPVLGPVTIHHDSNLNVSYTWQTTSSTAPGDYIITFHYPDVVGWDDQFLIHVVEDTGGGNPGTPAAPTGLQVSGITSNSITLSWNDVSDAVDYKLRVNGSSRGTTSSTSYTFTGLSPNTTYTLGVAAVNASNISSSYATTTAKTNPGIPDVPTGLWASSTHNSITLNWGSVSGASSYKIRLNGQDKGNTSSTSYTFSGLSPLTEYTLSVAAVGVAGSSGFASIQTTTKAQPLYLDSPADVSLPVNSTQIFSFTPSASGTYKITTGPYGGFGSDNDTLLDIYSDPEMTDLIETNDDTNGIFAELQPTLQSGVTYYIKLYGYDGSELHTRIIATGFNLSIPAIQLDSPVDVNMPAGQNAIFAFTPSTSGLYKINTGFFANTESSGVNDTILDVYRDLSLTDLVQNGHNDDAAQGTTFSEVNVSLQSGVTYYIKMSAYGSAPLHASLKVSLNTQTSFALLHNKVAVDVNKPAGAEAYFSFTPSETGLYRFFTSASQGSSSSDTELTLYSDPGMNNQIAFNDDVVGDRPYGALFSKIELTLFAGTTYYLKLRNVSFGNPLIARIMAEDSFLSSKSMAREATRDTTYNNDISSLYDTDYYKINVAEPSYIKLNLNANKVILENSSGNVVPTTGANGGYYAHIKDPGNYYVKVVSSGSTGGVSQPVPYSFKLSKVNVWYSLNTGSKTLYFKQSELQDTTLEARVSDNGSNNALVYTYANGQWSTNGSYAYTPVDSGIGIATTSGSDYEITQSLFDDVVIALTAQVDLVKETLANYMAFDIEAMTSDDWNMVTLGITTGIIDSSYIQFDPQNPLTYLNNNNIVRGLFLKVAGGLTDAQAEQNYYYIKSKAYTEYFIMIVARYVEYGSWGAAAVSLAHAGVAFTGGLATFVGTGGIGAPVAVAVEVDAVIALAASGAFSFAAMGAGKVGDSAEKAYNVDFAKLTGQMKRDMLKADGTFKDAALEAEYQLYVSRKERKQEKPRERLDWKEASDYYTKGSPIARGNAFNKKAEKAEWYPYNEVNLIDRRRVDSYNPTSGEIVSRKATNLEEIQLSTFEKYLKEMQDRYPAGKIIRSNKYPAIDGTPLVGKHILEIPASNQNFSELQEYINLAKNKYNIEIRFREE